MLPAVRSLAFLIGLLLGVFALLIVQNLGFLRLHGRPGQPRPVLLPGEEPSALSASEPRGTADAGLVERLVAAVGDPQGRNLDPLAVALEEAIFEKDWMKVQAIAHAIRAHGAAWVAPPTTPPPLPGEEKTLYEEVRELRRRQADEQLARRRNAATVFAGRTDPVAVAQLVDVLQHSRDAVERLDAAILIARAGNDAGLRALASALRAPDAAVRDAAARALAEEGYLAGASELASLLRADADLGLRRSAIHGFAHFEAVLRGEPQHPATQAFLETFRKDPAPEVRAAAAERLAEADLENGRVLADALYDALENDDAPEVREAALGSLRAFARAYGPPPGSLDALAASLKKERSAAIRAEMLAFLMEFGDAPTLRALDELAATPAGRESAAQLERVREVLNLRVTATHGR